MIAVWAVTREASNKGALIAEEIEGTLFVLKKFLPEKSSKAVSMENFSETLSLEFNRYDAHIFIMATGIVVRKITKLLKSKDKDPAIIVVDENMNFSISLVSGHLGGANRLAEEIAKKFKMVPIITTSSDITGKIALDTLAQKLNCQMESLEKAKRLTSLIVDGKKVELSLPDNLKISENSSSAEGVIIASNRENIEITRIYPKNLILGIGCRRGIEKDKIIDAVKAAMIKNNLSLKSIKLFSTVDLKADEAGLIEAVKEFDSTLAIISRESIKEVENSFQCSEFVRASIGVGVVSEACALLSSDKTGRFIEQKYIKDGVTVSIYEERFGNE